MHLLERSSFFFRSLFNQFFNLHFLVVDVGQSLLHCRELFLLIETIIQFLRFFLFGSIFQLSFVFLVFLVMFFMFLVFLMVFLMLLVLFMLFVFFMLFGFLVLSVFFVLLMLFVLFGFLVLFVSFLFVFAELSLNLVTVFPSHHVLGYSRKVRISFGSCFQSNDMFFKLISFLTAFQIPLFLNCLSTFEFFIITFDAFRLVPSFLV